MLSRHEKVLREYLPLTLGFVTTITRDSGAYVLLDRLYTQVCLECPTTSFRIKVRDTEYMVKRGQYQFQVKNIGSKVYEVTTPFEDLETSAYREACLALRQHLIEQYTEGFVSVRVLDNSKHFDTCLAFYVGGGGVGSMMVNLVAGDTQVDWIMSYDHEGRWFTFTRHPKKIVSL